MPRVRRLVAHVQREPALRNRERHHGIEPRRTQTTADDQQAQRTVAPREALGRRRLHDDLRAHRVADHARFDAGGKRVGKRRDTRRARCARQRFE
jgi:hypothetical protein